MRKHRKLNIVGGCLVLLSTLALCVLGLAAGYPYCVVFAMLSVVLLMFALRSSMVSAHLVVLGGVDALAVRGRRQP